MVLFLDLIVYKGLLCNKKAYIFFKKVILFWKYINILLNILKKDYSK